jgi:Skp family chaperone for outer membrane proteins
MNRKLLIIAFAFILFLGTTSAAFAQGPATQPKSQTTAAQPSAVNVPVSKVAVIFSVAFQDPKAGIAKFTVLLSQLNAQFQKTQDDLNQTGQKIKQLEDEIAKAQASGGGDPKVVQAKIDQHDQLKKDAQRKTEDGQAAYQKRRDEIFAPLQDDVAKYLDTYAKAHGITLIIDGSQIEGILFAADNVDITKAFISDYNLKNPATASVTTPK